jgi:TIR domain
VARIFISYRREDCPAHAGRLYDTLSARFGEANVFMDVDTLEPGVDFVQRIEEAVGSTDVLLALIGDNWLTVTDADGNRRIDQPGDFVQLEVARGLARDDVRVVPVLVEGAEMPVAAELPEPLKPLARRNGVALSETRWRSDTSELVGAIEAIPAPGSGPVTPRPGPAPARRGGSWLLLVPALVCLGGPALVYAGARAGERRWLYAGLAYSALLLVAFVFLAALPEDHALNAVFAALLFVSWIGSAIHLLVVRPQYAARPVR